MDWLGEVGGAWNRIPAPVRRVVIPSLVLVALVLYPSYYGSLTSAIGTNSTEALLVPTTGTMVIMTVYVIMALGLNVVVGYAGLLDLGYVAFYAAGAYIAGWFATQQFATHNLHILSVGVPGTIRVWARALQPNPPTTVSASAPPHRWGVIRLTCPGIPT